MAADAYAHAIRPTHTTNDGDTIYTLASGKLGGPGKAPRSPRPAGHARVRALETAIVNGAKTAQNLPRHPGCREVN